MIRVISGKYRGKKLVEPQTKDVTRATMDRVKESMFAILQYAIKDAKVLDLFSGTGSLGIEALSNHAKKAVFVDSNKDAIAMIKTNLEKVGEQAEVLQSDYLDAISRFARMGVKFDIVFLDPPYKSEFGFSAINEIVNKKILEKDGIIVFETSENFNFSEKFNVDERKYGSKKVYFLKQK